MLKKLLKGFEPKRFLEYMVSGGAYFWFGYFVFFVCDQWLHLNLWWAKLLANVSGWTINYLLQRYWVFADGRKASEQAISGRYAVITLVDFLLDYLIVAGLQMLGLTPYIGQFVSSAFFTVWNYAWYKWWVFPAKYVHRARKSTKKRKHPAQRKRRK
ncbi:MAG: hypothetical protein JWM37_32 [Candidatus Saccharibacteria bacterium]|nr:hypothetical protein [Candidatus Saccharibacteria bacterium]